MNIIPATTKRNCTALGLGLLLPQNGVVTEGAVSLPSAATMDSRNGNGSLLRPTALVVKNEHRNNSKTFRDEDYDRSDGSLPCTPELQSDSELEVSGFSAEEDEVLEADTRQLLSDFLQIITGLSQPRWNQRPALTTMKRVVENLLEKHRYAYNGMINKLSLDDRGDDVTFVTSVAKNIFEDGTTNWGRIASLISFGAVVCQYLKSKGRESCVEKVAQEISTYLLTDQRDWLVRNNAWTGFVEFFRVDDPESKVRNTLMAVAGLAGIGATLAMLIRDGPESLVRNALVAPAGLAGVCATVAWLIR